MQNYQLKPSTTLQILLIFIFFGCNCVHAQTGIKMMNAVDYDSKKYDDYRGSPYLWEENKKVVIFDKHGREHTVIKGNYNVLENEFEVYQKGKFIQLPHATYPIIKIVEDPNITYSLRSNVHPKLRNKYCILHAKTNNYFVYESRTAKQKSVKVETPGVPTYFNKINPRSEYYIVFGSKLISFKISKKKLIKQFGHKKEINSFLKENKIKIKKIEDVLRLFDFLDSKGWLVD